MGRRATWAASAVLACAAGSGAGAGAGAGPVQAAEPEPMPACRVTGIPAGEPDSAAICALFAEVLAARPGSCVTLALPRPWHATAVVTAAGGEELARAGVSVSDKRLDSQAWRELAAQVLRQLS